jgi:hypothetical protein
VKVVYNGDVKNLVAKKSGTIIRWIFINLFFFLFVYMLKLWGCNER